MSAPTLPDLLDGLGEVFLTPGAGGGDGSGTALAPWCSPGLREGLRAMAEAPRGDLEVAYAGLFLAGFRQPTIHLELSVLRTGLLQDEDVLRDLEGPFEAAGLQAGPGVPADHLGTLLMLLGHLLRRDLPGPAGVLLHDHLEPLSARVVSELERSGVPAFYAAAGRSLRETLRLCASLLADQGPPGVAAAGGSPV